MADKGLLQRLRDRRTKERQRVEEIFDRKTLLSILVIMPLSKTVEQIIVWQPAYAARYFGWFVVAVVVSVGWHRISEGAANVAEKAKDAAEDATEGG
jgi:hypothetical protein